MLWWLGPVWSKFDFVGSSSVGHEVCHVVNNVLLRGFVKIVKIVNSMFSLCAVWSYFSLLPR